MPRKPNYRGLRAERDRKKAEKRAAKAEKRQAARHGETVDEHAAPAPTEEVEE